MQDLDWRFRYINAKAAEVLGEVEGTHGDLIGRVVWEVFPQLKGSRTETLMRRAARERIPIAFEARTADGRRWSSLYCYPLPDGGLATQWRDITERKRAEEAAHYLSRASDVLSSSLDYEQTLADLARLVVPELADWCTVDVATDEGIRAVALAHAHPEKVRWAHELANEIPSRSRCADGGAERSPHGETGVGFRDHRRDARGERGGRRVPPHHS